MRRNEAAREPVVELFPDASPNAYRDAPTAPTAAHDGRSVGSLFVDLTRELKDLFTTEVELARAELSSKIEHLTTGLGSLVVGGAVALVGAMTLVAAAIIALHRYAIEELWVAASVVGVAVTLIGLGLIATGKSRMDPEKLVPKRVAENLREDARFFQQEIEERRA